MPIDAPSLLTLAEKATRAIDLRRLDTAAINEPGTAEHRHRYADLVAFAVRDYHAALWELRSAAVGAAFFRRRAKEQAVAEAARDYRAAILMFDRRLPGALATAYHSVAALDAALAELSALDVGETADAA